MIDFVIEGPLLDRIRRALRDGFDFAPAMRTIADYMRTTTVERFEDQRSPAGVPWQPSRRAVAEGGLTLVDSGELKLSITADSDATSAIVGTNKVYAAVHNFGHSFTTRRGQALSRPVVVPQREFLGFSDDDQAEISAILVDHLRGAFGGAAGAGGAA